ncbi:MAG: MaoC/PaaZ C-terminal domain-containing protein [Candidatus Paceibacterota bacterium]|jgi:3-hydroxybutyryl-CoA dehydratase
MNEAVSPNAVCRLGLSDLAVGKEFVSSRSFSAENTKMAALLSGDHNPVHSDDGFARSMGFEMAIIHGANISMELSRLVGHHFFVDGTVAWEANLKFPRPIYHDQPVKITLAITEIDGRKIKFAVSILNAIGKICVKGELVVIFPG